MRKPLSSTVVAVAASLGAILGETALVIGTPSAVAHGAELSPTVPAGWSGPAPQPAALSGSPGTVSPPEGAPPPPLAGAERLGGPIALRDIDLVRRDMDGLARRHNLPVPPPGATRVQLRGCFWRTVNALAKLPKEELSSRDFIDIGVLTQDFEDVVDEVRGKMALAAAQADLPPRIPGAISKEKGEEFETRLKSLEKVDINGDFTYLPQSDLGHTTRGATGANMRARINFQTRVTEAQPQGIAGDGRLFLRLTAGAGRFFPRNRYLMSPYNDLTDYAQNPFNSGPQENQTGYVINNNNSNNTRPTVSLEQAWYGQDLRFGKGLTGMYQVGLNSFANIFDSNAFANNETLQFANSQFVNNTSWRLNFIGPSTVFRLEKSLFRDKAFLRATSGFISLANRDIFGGYGTDHELQFGQRFFGKEGNLRAGFWQFNFRGGSPTPLVTPVDFTPPGLLAGIPDAQGVGVGSRPVGFYLNADQKIWKDIGLWGRYGLNDRSIGQIFLGGLLSSRAAWSFGTEVPVKILVKKRPNDVVGVAFGQIASYRRGTITPATPAFVSLGGVPATTLEQVNANVATIDSGTRPATEKVLEAYYRAQLNKNISLGPDIQYIWSPGATKPQPGIFILGARLNVTF